MRFVTRIYHPNVKTDSGEICSDILNENWGPTLNVTYVLNTIRQVRLFSPRRSGLSVGKQSSRSELPSIHGKRDNASVGTLPRLAV